VITIVSLGQYRKAKKEDVDSLKEIWQSCFNDPREFIDYYYANQFNEEFTRVLSMENGEIGAMLTLKPVNLITWQEEIIYSTMLYAVATHPKFQKQGLASELINKANEELVKNGVYTSVVVPAEPGLFDFYKKLGYQEVFYIRESVLTPDAIMQSHPGPTFSCSIIPDDPWEYNLRRNRLLNGSYFIAYTEDDIKYQKEIARMTGGDIYRVVLPDVQGCLIVERVNEKKVIIKELLCFKQYFPKILRKICEEFPAEEYVVRTSGYLDHKMSGIPKPFAMIKIDPKANMLISPEERAYLGLAFD